MKYISTGYTARAALITLLVLNVPKSHAMQPTEQDQELSKKISQIDKQIKNLLTRRNELTIELKTQKNATIIASLQKELQTHTIRKSELQAFLEQTKNIELKTEKTMRVMQTVRAERTAELDETTARESEILKVLNQLKQSIHQGIENTSHERNGN